MLASYYIVILYTIYTGRTVFARPLLKGVLCQYNYADMPRMNIQISLKFHAACAASKVLQNYNDLGLKEIIAHRHADLSSEMSGQGHAETTQDLIRSTTIPRVDSEGGLDGCRGGKEEIKTYWWRWVVLGVFVGILAINNTIWITFGPIADVMSCYYGVSDFWVNSLSMVYMLVYTLFVVPSIWLLNAVGLRNTVVIAACCSAAGAGLRMAAVGERKQMHHALLATQKSASTTFLTSSYIANKLSSYGSKSSLLGGMSPYIKAYL